MAIELAICVHLSIWGKRISATTAIQNFRQLRSYLNYEGTHDFRTPDALFEGWNRIGPSHVFENAHDVRIEVRDSRGSSESRWDGS